MSIRHSCDQCGKDFNFRIKLNRHIKIVHKEKSSDEFYLKPETSLSDEDKIKYFEELRRKYQELSSKASNSEKRFKYLQEKVKKLEKTKCKSRKRATKFVGSEHRSGSFEEIENDNTIPDGWKSCYKVMPESFGKDCKIKVYWAPDGRFFQSRRQAINFMLTEVETVPADLEVMKNGLYEDGWIEDGEFLPKGWLVQAKSDGKFFITEEYSLLKGARNVLKHMAVRNSDEEIGKFLCKYHFKNEVNPFNIKWMIGDSIPFPWRVANITYKSGNKSQVITSPDGQIFSCMKSAVDFIENFNVLEKIDADSFVSFVGKMNYEEKLAEEDWVPDTTLPEGWRSLKRVDERYTRYLSPSGETFATRAAAIDHLKTVGVEIKPEVKVKKEKDSTIIKVEKPKPVYDWQTNESIPEDWSVGIIDGEVKKYKDPSGAIFRDRPDAIRSMLSNPDCSEEDIKLMKDGLLKDDWIDVSFLPKGWMMQTRTRLYNNKKARASYTVYLNPVCEVMLGFEKVYQHLKMSGCSEEELMTFKEQCPNKWKKGDFLPEGWMYSVITMATGRTFNVYLNPEGKYFSGVHPIFRHYKDNFESSDAKNKFLTLLYGNGWFTSEFLPPGFLCKPRCVLRGGMSYLSPEFTLLKNTKSVVKYMVNQGIDADIIHAFKRNWKNLLGKNLIDIEENEVSKESTENDEKETHNEKDESGENDEEDETNLGLQWTEDENLPSGWKISISKLSVSQGPLSGRICYRFLSDSGDLYGSRSEAYKALINDADIDLEVIIRFKESFAQEGWVTEDFMPENWLLKRHPYGSSYMSPSGDILTSNHLALRYLIENEYTLEEIDIFKQRECPVVIKPKTRGKLKKKESNTDRDASDKVKMLEQLPNVTISKLNQGESSLEKEVEKSPEESGTTNDLRMDPAVKDNKVRRDPNVNYDWQTDDTLPTGWKSSHRSSALGSIKDLKIKMYQAPTGRIFGSRPQALRYMTTSPTFTELNIEEMKTGLAEEGWISNNFLPEGWMIKTLNFGGFVILTDRFETLKSIRKVCLFMESKGYSEDIIKRFKTDLPLFIREFGVSEKKVMMDPVETMVPSKKRKMPDSNENLNSPKLLKSDDTWTVGDDTVPEGWKIKKDFSGVQFRSGKGKIFQSRAEALKFMCRNPVTLDGKEVEELRSKLKHESWEDHDLLPKNWKLKRVDGGAVFFLSEIGGLNRTSKGARDNIKTRNNSEELKNFNSLIDQLKPTNRCKFDTNIDEKASDIKYEPLDETVAAKSVNNDNPMMTDVPLPTGWTEAVKSDEIVYISAEGDKITSRLAFVRHLVLSKSDPKIIYALWNTLDLEGWMLGDDLVPPGWRMKQYKGLCEYKYLTREMTVINNSEEALKHIVDSNDYNNENEDNFKKWHSENMKKMASVTWKNDSSLPNGWTLSSNYKNTVTIRDVHGTLFDTRKEAIDYMIKEHYAPTDIFNLWNTLHLEGWMNDETFLPTGWKKKFYPEKKIFHYLSPMMEVVRTSEALLKIVGAGKEYTEEEVNKIRSWIKQL